MKRLLVFLFLPVLLGSCKNYSRYAIDETPQIKLDSTLLGIWTVVEDTDKQNFILVQDYRDVFNTDYKPEKNLKTRRFDYYISYYNHHGKNPLYQEWRSYLSVVQRDSFLNIRYSYSPHSQETYDGFVFAKLMRKGDLRMDIARIADTGLIKMKSSAQLRDYFKKNASRRPFYSDTLHLRKVSFFHGKVQPTPLKSKNPLTD